MFRSMHRPSSGGTETTLYSHPQVLSVNLHDIQLISVREYNRSPNIHLFVSQQFINTDFKIRKTTIRQAKGV